MAQLRRKKIFISFAIEDCRYRNYLRDQSIKETSPFDFVDMSIKKRLPEFKWKNICDERIRDSDGMIVLLSNNTISAQGVKYEIQCARKHNIKIMGMIIDKRSNCSIPGDIKHYMIWSWDNIVKFIQSL